ncbi:hypothetical protein NL676_008525 [Syzygium grande]|nr:hypothetical protein NL676_008525 [Syzygium grande]
MPENGAFAAQAMTLYTQRRRERGFSVDDERYQWGERNNGGKCQEEGGGEEEEEREKLQRQVWGEGASSTTAGRHGSVDQSFNAGEEEDGECGPRAARRRVGVGSGSWEICNGVTGAAARDDGDADRGPVLDRPPSVLDRSPFDSLVVALTAMLIKSQTWQLFTSVRHEPGLDKSRSTP